MFGKASREYRLFWVLGGEAQLKQGSPSLSLIFESMCKERSELLSHELGVRES